MLSQVILQSSTPMTLKVEDMDPAEILLLKSITGLSPENITLFTGDFARDGGYYQGRRVGKRNPVLTFKLNPNYASNIETSDVRELLYKMFLQPQAGSDGLKVLLDDDRRPDRYFIGYTESINTDMWSDKQEAQVSMVCVDPYLRSDTATSVVDATGFISTPVTYDGSAAAGMTIGLKVITANSQIVVDLNGLTMTLIGTFAINDIIDINTTIGSRSIKKNGVDIMAALTGTPVWPTLSAAANTLKTYSTVVADGKVKIMNYGFRSAWWGI